MSAKVVAFNGERVGDAVPEVVSLLEEWLERARSGEVQAVAVLAVVEGAGMLYSRVENGRWAALVAAHDISRHAMLTQAYEANGG